MTITTKKGDKGRSCWGGVEVDKDGLLLEVIGEMDELSAVFQLIGVRFEGDEWEELATNLGEIMGVLALKGECSLKKRIEVMEKEIEKGEKELAKIDGFVSFKTEKGAMINWGRTVTRRVERRVVSLSKKEKVEKDVLVYLNRLSDYLFTLARKVE